MPEEFNLETLTKSWRDFLSEYCKKELLDIANSYPEKRSLLVSYTDIEVFDPDLAVYLLDRPNSAVYAAEVAMKEAMPPDVKASPHFRVKDLPPRPLAVTEVRELRSRHIGKLVAVKGLVRKATQVKPKIIDAVFQCARCGAVVREPQSDTVYKEPLECYKDQGGCAKSAASTRFILLTGESVQAQLKGGAGAPQSVFIDTQKIEIQESPEGLRGGDQPERLTAYAEDDLCKKISPGDKVILNGVLRSHQKAVGQVKSTFFDWFLEVNSVEVQDHDFEEVEISPEEEEKILKMSRDKEIYHRITASIAPTIYGMETEKEALALQMFGGVTKVMPDSTRVRGDIHILLCGDPGTAKSQLLRYVSTIVPRGIYASGKATTGAGLTAAAVHDEFGEGRWTLEAGALVLADKGMACVDELDKMSEQDTSSMHEAMEQQRISVAKAGITATLQCRCSILAAANPKEGRFDEHSYLADQIDLSPTLLSRFDVIFPLTDKPDQKKDAALAAHILNVHLAGEIAQYRKNAQDKRYSKEDERRVMRKVEPEISLEMMRKYIAYSRSRIFPVMSKSTIEILQEYYVNIRTQSRGTEGEGGGAVPMTPRQMEALVRLSEASARVRLSHEVTEEDADRAKRIVEYFLRKVASEGGRLDIDAIMTGQTSSQRERVHSIIDIIEELDDGKGVTEEEVLRRSREGGLDIDKVKRDLQRMVNDGRLYMPTGDRYKVAGERK